ncbi:MAG: sodium:alanine symporter family protein [Magnetococcales bacterium]|nr:sodium:alanine symporter family protein [Magnetococcales bacterium]MBF0631605.1 sodium:alanine symporter family protein [Magnetococcales bacterium]
MDTIAAWIWNPMLSLIYIETGLLFLIATQGLSLRFPRNVLRKIWNVEEKGNANPRHISHGRAFSAALAASVGVGNLAGVGTAIHLGGPGAMFWLWVSAIVGGSFQMCSAYLAIRHGPGKTDSPLYATPMSYIVKFTGQSWPMTAPILAGLILFHGMVSANLIQANSVSRSLANQMGTSDFLVAALLFVTVAAAIIGGLKSIITISSFLAPWLVLLFVGSGLLVLFLNPRATLEAFQLIVTSAFHPYAIGGGIAGHTVMQAMQFGVSRGVFSHFSGMGTAPFLQSSNDDHPAVSAYLAALVPLVDSLMVCSITGLVVLVTGDWHQYTGAYLTATAFQTALGDTGRIVVFICLVIFAYTTIISWAHFAERCFQYLGGRRVIVFRWLFAGVTFCGPFMPVNFIWSLADCVIGLMLLFHLLPMTYIVIKTLPELLNDLKNND